MEETKRKVGRPTKYTSKMPDKLRAYYTRPLFEKKKIQQATASGKIVEIEVDAPCLPPISEGFCVEVGIGMTTFHRWLDAHEEFRAAYDECKSKQAVILSSHALMNNYNASISKLFLANCTQYRDKQEVEHSGEIKMNIDKSDSEL